MDLNAAESLFTQRNYLARDQQRFRIPGVRCQCEGEMAKVTLTVMRPASPLDLLRERPGGQCGACRYEDVLTAVDHVGNR